MNKSQRRNRNRLRRSSTNVRARSSKKKSQGRLVSDHILSCCLSFLSVSSLCSHRRFSSKALTSSNKRRKADEASESFAKTSGRLSSTSLSSTKNDTNDEKENKRSKTGGSSNLLSAKGATSNATSDSSTLSSAVSKSAESKRRRNTTTETIGYAQGVRDRWDTNNLAFVVDSAENAMKAISESYPDQISLVMLQFPTPYRLNDDVESYTCAETSSSVAKRDFNSQLPEAASSANFMVSENLLSQIHDVLSNHSGQLLIQSNCEDVAVHMKNVALRVGFQSSKSFSNHVLELDITTQRQKRWVAMGGERAIGSHWASGPLLPVRGRTETEVACSLDSKPVHRCLLKAEVS